MTFAKSYSVSMLAFQVEACSWVAVNDADPLYMFARVADGRPLPLHPSASVKTDDRVAAQPVSKRIRWFIDNTEKGMSSKTNRRFVDEHADIVTGIIPCCSFAGFWSCDVWANPACDRSSGRSLLTVADENAGDMGRRDAADSFFRHMLSQGKTVTPTINGGPLPVQAFERRDELAEEVQAVRIIRSSSIGL